MGFATLRIGVSFELANPQSGLHFATADHIRFPYRWAHAHSSDLRSIMPCLDNLRDKGTWDLEFVVPRTVERYNGADLETHDTVVVCSGDLLEQLVHPSDSRLKVVHYSVPAPISARSIAFAVGPFEAHSINGWKAKPRHLEAGTDDAGQPLDSGGTLFVLPGRSQDGSTDLRFLGDALDFFVNEYLTSSYPYSSFKVVAVENVFVPVKVGATIVILGSHLLVPDGAIEQTYETRALLSRSLAQQWFGHYLAPRAWNDTWLFVAVTTYMSHLFLASQFGIAGYKARMRAAAELATQLDVHQLPLCPLPSYTRDVFGLLPTDIVHGGSGMRADVLEVFHNEFESADVRALLLEVKGALVLSMLDKRLGKGVLQKTLAHILLEHTSGDLPEGLGTQHFLKQCKTFAGTVDVKEFSTQWIHGSGMPCLQFKFQLNRRKQVVEVQMLQSNRSYQAGNAAATRAFSGAFTIRAHEPAGTFDTDIQIDDVEQNFELQYHSRSRKVQREAPGARSVQPGNANANVEAMRGREALDVDMDDSGGLDEGFDWIRLDPDNEWLCVKENVQNGIMWEAQLSKDRDINAQLEAVKALASSDGPHTVDVLARTIKNHSAFHGVRVEAGRSLARIASGRTPQGRRAFEALASVFRDLFCFPGSGGRSGRNIPRLAGVQDIAGYFVHKGLLGAIASARPDDPRLQSERRALLLEQLRSRDRAAESYDDSCLLGFLVQAIAAAQATPDIDTGNLDEESNPVQAAFESLGEDDDENQRVQNAYARSAAAAKWDRAMNPEEVAFFRDTLVELRNLQALDQALPSYQNVISVACVKAAVLVMLGGIYPVDFHPFLNWTSYGHFVGLRMAAFDALLLLGGLSVPSVSNYLLLTIACDSVPFVRYHVARSMAYYALYLSRSGDPEAEHAAPSSSSDTVAMSQDGASLAQLLSQVPRVVLDAVRQKIHRDRRLQATVWALLDDHLTVDIRIRHSLLRFCEAVYEPNATAIAIALANQYKYRPPTQHSGASLPSRHHRAASPTDPPETTFLEKGLQLLQTLHDSPWSEAFKFPIEVAYPEAAASYLVIIKQPMDLQTIEGKLRSGRYRNEARKLDQDVQLIFRNCYQYNQEFSGVYQAAKQLEKIYYRNAAPAFYAGLGLELPSTLANTKRLLDLQVADGDGIDERPGTSGTLSPELRKCRTILSNLVKKQSSRWFRNPVDPEKEGIPTYFNVVKQPMDFGTIRKNLDSLAYPDVSSFVADMELVFSNSYLFNAVESMTHKDTVIVEKAFREAMRQAGLGSFLGAQRPEGALRPAFVPANGASEGPKDATLLAHSVPAASPSTGSLPAQPLAESPQRVQLPSAEAVTVSKGLGLEGLSIPGSEDFGNAPGGNNAGSRPLTDALAVSPGLPAGAESSAQSLVRPLNGVPGDRVGEASRPGLAEAAVRVTGAASDTIATTGVGSVSAAVPVTLEAQGAASGPLLSSVDSHALPAAVGIAVGSATAPLPVAQVSTAAPAPVTPPSFAPSTDSHSVPAVAGASSTIVAPLPVAEPAATPPTATAAKGSLTPKKAAVPKPPAPAKTPFELMNEVLEGLERNENSEWFREPVPLDFFTDYLSVVEVSSGSALHVWMDLENVYRRQSR
ncbi:hypothetical protein DFJ74DRAFT_360250 [Hyaloraphidium curvatum]|nr:hypothetical protein DFJ74DRAFT_360250 [Hyaloraphidium curvatum]